MEQDRFDALAKKVFSGTSRRRVVGGALASVLGVGVAAVTGVDAKNKKAKAQGKKGKSKGEFTCAGPNGGPSNPCPAGSCCASSPAGNANPSCVDLITQIAGGPGGICGDAAGEGVCRTCPPGTKCGIDPITGDLRCVCNAGTGCTGCCIDNSGFGGDDACVANGNGAPVSSPNPFFDGEFVCGTGGQVCDTCGGTFFNGCCTANGACAAGTSNASCGSSGQLCETCTNDSSCGIDQACTGGTTTTTTTVAPTTTLAPCGTTNNGKPKVRCGTGATSVCCKKCKSDNSGCKRRKKH